MKRCPQCLIELPRSAFSNNRTSYDGLAAYCRPCIQERKNYYKQRNPDRHRELQRASYKRFRIRHGLGTAMNAPARVPKDRAMFLRMHSANKQVAWAIRTGKLKRPSTCERCGATAKRIEAAHHDYTKPLDVRWLCSRCHRVWDLEEPKAHTVLPLVIRRQPEGSAA